MIDPKRFAPNFRARLPKFPQRLKNLLLLVCSLLVGLLPLLAWLALIMLWYYAPWSFSLDMTKLTLGLLLLSPFAAGFVNCRWHGRDSAQCLRAGAWPAFWLWLGAAAAYTWLFAETPQPEKALVALAVSLLLGIAGAMSAARLSKFAGPKQPAENTNA